MTFDEVLAQVIDLLQREGRVSYRALKRRFTLDDEYLEDLKAEIIQAKKLATDEDGAVLVWTGGETGKETENRRIGENQSGVWRPGSGVWNKFCRAASVDSDVLRPGGLHRAIRAT